MPGFTVVAPMKNEGAFVLEWVAHQKAVGFDHILVATNDCADPTVDLLLRLQEMGIVRHHATRIWPAGGIQRSALKQSLWYDEVKTAEAVFVCDADEFLVVKAGDGTIRALAAMAGAGWEAIAVPWRIFGPAGCIAYADRPVTQQFTLAEADPGAASPAGTYGKSLFRALANVRRFGVHGPEAQPDLGRDLHREMPGGKPYAQCGNRLQIAPDYAVAQVNHYALRSRQSFYVKRDRGRINHVGKDMDLTYWRRFDRAATPCDAIRRYDAALAGWLQRFHADPALARLHAEAVAWHSAKIADLLARPDVQALDAAIAAGEG